MLFNDQSGSMTGQPFAAVKNACLTIADNIFAADPEDNAFEEVDLVFYQSRATRTTTSSKEEYLARVKRERVCGGTDFHPCYNEIK